MGILIKSAAKWLKNFCFLDMALTHQMKRLMLYQVVRHVKVSALRVQGLKMMSVMICLVILYVLHVQSILKWYYLKMLKVCFQKLKMAKGVHHLIIYVIHLRIKMYHLHIILYQGSRTQSFLKHVIMEYHSLGKGCFL